MNFYILCILIVSLIIALNNQGQGEPSCSVVINELNSDVPMHGGEKEHGEFIELKGNNCQRGKTLCDYMLLLVEEYSNKLKKPQIVMSIDLYYQKLSNSGFFVIGSSEVKGNMKFSDAGISFKEQVNSKSTISSYFATSKTNAISNGNKYPMALLLLKDKGHTSKTFNNLKLSVCDPKTHRVTKVNDIAIDEEIETILRNSLVDLVIYARRSIYYNCGFF